MELRLLLAAALCAAATALLGALVARGGTAAMDRSGFALRGHGVRAAYLFTLLGRWPQLTAAGVLAFVIAMALREGLHALTALLCTQVVSQLANSALKLAYRRARPGRYIGKLEREYAYPSGHSVTAMVFFLGFAVLVWQAPFPHAIQGALCAALVVCALGIPWSRLALGAHYVSDVIGGVLFGVAWLCALLAIVSSQPAYFAR